MNRSVHRTRRRGFTLFELMLSGALMLGVTLTLAGFTRLNHLSWKSAVNNTTAQTTAQLAIQRMAPGIREARRVLVGSSSPTRLTLQMPAYDASGNLVIPLQDGQVISYYLSDQTGSPSRTGTILWRSVNGTPDSGWSLAGGRGRVVLSADGLRFAYYPTTDPATVTVTVTASGSSASGDGARASASSDPSAVTVTQELLLRNRDVR